MKNAFTVRSAPDYYLCEEGVLNQLEKLLVERNLSNILIIHGKKSLQVASPYLPSFQKVKVSYEQYLGECTEEEVARIKDIIETNTYDAVIGIGGGKVMDVSKASADRSFVPVILIPTLAATCAPWTPLSVFYNEEGQFQYYTYQKYNIALLLVEPRILLDSPKNYFVAGIADTLAKWYEADVVIREKKEVSLNYQIAHATAKTCKDVLFEHSVAAVESLEMKQLSFAFLQVVETIFMAGGMVGGYGGTVSGAHAIHNGLTQLTETHHLLHGEKVGYGILIQLVLENNWKEIQSLIPFYHQLNIPSTLSDLHLSANDELQLRKAAKRATIETESIHSMLDETNEETVYQAFLHLDKYLLLHA